MALTNTDKNYLEKTFVKKEELGETNDRILRLEQRVAGETRRLDGKFSEEIHRLDEKFTGEIRRLELLTEHGFDELRGILGDILDYVKEIPVQRQRLDDHDMQIRQLNRTVYGGEASSE